MYHIVIDDERTFEENTFPPNGVVVYLRSSDEAIVWFAKWLVAYIDGKYLDRDEHIAQIWFDHDLGDGDEATVVAKFLVSGVFPYMARITLQDQLKLFVHTQNPVGANNIMGVFLDNGYNPVRCGLPELV